MLLAGRLLVRVDGRNKWLSLAHTTWQPESKLDTALSQKWLHFRPFFPFYCSWYLPNQAAARHEALPSRNLTPTPSDYKKLERSFLLVITLNHQSFSSPRFIFILFTALGCFLRVTETNGMRYLPVDPAVVEVVYLIMVWTETWFSFFSLLFILLATCLPLYLFHG